MLARSVSAHGALSLKGVTEPDTLAATAPVSIGLLGGQTQLTRQRRHAQILEATWRSWGRSALVREVDNVGVFIIFAIFRHAALLTKSEGCYKAFSSSL